MRGQNRFRQENSCWFEGHGRKQRRKGMGMGTGTWIRMCILISSPEHTVKNFYAVVSFSVWRIAAYPFLNADLCLLESIAPVKTK